MATVSVGRRARIEIDHEELLRWINREGKRRKTASGGYKYANLDGKNAELGMGDLRVMRAVARSKTLRASAIFLRVNQSTVSRRVAALETALGRQAI
jgi:hypothetical protein